MVPSRRCRHRELLKSREPVAHLADGGIEVEYELKSVSLSWRSSGRRAGGLRNAVQSDLGWPSGRMAIAAPSASPWLGPVVCPGRCWSMP